jgi:hypothetical protein
MNAVETLKGGDYDMGSSPHSGGLKVFEAVMRRTKERILKYAEKSAENFTRANTRFLGESCHSDAHIELSVPQGSSPPHRPESSEEHIDRLQNTPAHLLRLRYFGHEFRWAFAFLAYRRDTYELCRRFQLVNSFLDLPLGVRLALRIIQRMNDARRRPAVDMKSSETSISGHTSLATIHGFRVQSYGKRLSAGFKRGLRRLAERGFDDPTCVVVKTASGKRSGITHAGGRYVHPGNPHRTLVMQEMRDLGMEPPPPPFIVTPGEYTLYHEWGHHVDRTWSGDNQETSFSFRWLSRFYKLCVPPSHIAHADHHFPVDYDNVRPIESHVHAANAVVVWWHTSSELFADLFEDWMRAEKKVAWDQCETQSLNPPGSRGDPSVRIGLLPGVRADDVRAETYALFAAGFRTRADLPPVRPDLLGAKTDEMVGHLREVLSRARAGLL